MSIRAFLPTPRTIRQSRQDSTSTEASGFPPQAPWRRATALGLAILLLPFTQLDLFAQQAPGPPAGYQQQQQQDYPPPPPDDQTQTPQYQAPQYQQQPQYQQPYPNSAQQPQYDQQPQYQPPQYQQPQYPQQPYDQQAPPAPDEAYSQQYPPPPAQQQAALGPDQLNQLVAPVALYPDSLIAQILAASTFPEQVASADRWRQSMAYAAPQDIAAGANAQPWDPSVKSLTAFPQVLAELDQNLSWTTELGNAYYNQPQDVFDAIQALRQRAQAAGTLQNTPQETVTDDQGTIALAPANPQIVYVPTYDPWTAYGAPVNPWPGFLLDAIGGVIGGIGMRFGPGLVLSAFTAMPWGYLGWGLSWLGHCLFFGNEGYYPHGPGLRDWGLRYGGPRAPWGRSFSYARAYDRGFGHGYGRGYDGRGGYSARGGFENGARGGFENGARGGFGETARGGAYGRGGFDGRTGAYGNRSYGQNPGYGQNRGFAENRGYATPRTGPTTPPGYRGGAGAYDRAGQQAYNRAPAFNARPNSGYGYGNSGAYNRPGASYGQGFNGRTSSFPQQSYRSTPSYGSGYGSGMSRPSAPSSLSRGFSNSYRQPSFSQPQSSFRSQAPSYRAYGGSSGFSQNSRAFSGSQRSGGFSGGGGHSSFSGGGSRGFSGGGGHSFSGGGHSSGGHSGGGHSGGGHSGGGGHHR